MQHGMADVEPGLRLHYVTAGAGPRTIVLLHGFPQTWWQWHHVIPAFVDAGLRVVAPDYRGAGHSWRPAGGYLYRAFDQDAADNRAALERNGPLTVPVLAVGGEISTSGPVIEEMTREVASDVTGVRVPATGHWVAEENPRAFADAVLDWLG